MLVVDARHQSGSRRKDFIDEDEDGLFGRQLDSLSNDIDELTDGQICGYQVLLLVDRCNVGFFDLLADDLGIVSDIRRAEEEKRTGILSAYFCRMRSASALRFSSLCSSLNLDRMIVVFRGLNAGRVMYPIIRAETYAANVLWRWVVRGRQEVIK